MNRIREPAAFLPRRETRRACAAILGMAAATLSAPSQPATADSIPARTVLEQASWNAGPPPPSGSTAPAGPGSGRILAATARSADMPNNPSVVGQPFRLPVILAVEPYLLPGFDPSAPRFVLPAATGEPMLRSFAGADDTGATSIVEVALADAARSYLAQIAPRGIDTLREARCAAAVPRPAGCEETSETDAARGGLLSGLSFAAIPLPPALVLLLAALVCLAAIAWRRKRLGL